MGNVGRVGGGGFQPLDEGAGGAEPQRTEGPQPPVMPRVGAGDGGAAALRAKLSLDAVEGKAPNWRVAHRHHRHPSPAPAPGPIMRPMYGMVAPHPGGGRPHPTPPAHPGPIMRPMYGMVAPTPRPVAGPPVMRPMYGMVAPNPHPIDGPPIMRPMYGMVAPAPGHHHRGGHHGGHGGLPPFRPMYGMVAPIPKPVNRA